MLQLKLGPNAGAWAAAMQHHHRLGALAAFVVVNPQVKVAFLDAGDDNINPDQ